MTDGEAASTAGEAGVTVRDDLQGVPAEVYGEAHAHHLMDIYALYVEMTDRISQRRQTANSFFLSINSAIVALVGYVNVGAQDGAQSLFHMPVAVAGIILCTVWYRLILSYRGLNSGKFRVIDEIEALLPIRPYAAEWSALARGEDPKLFRPFTSFEVMVPKIFMGLHVVVLVLAVIASVRGDG